MADDKKKKKKSAADIINDAAAKKKAAAAKKKAPAFNKGIQPVDVKDYLENVDQHKVRALMSRNFALWAAFAGIKVDGNPLQFESHRYLLPIYMDHGSHVVWMKAAQLGATVYMLLRLMWYCRNKEVEVDDVGGGKFRRGPNVALYFPTGGGVEDLAKARLNPMIASNDELLDNLTEVDTLSLKQFRNVYGTVSSLYMTYMGGKDSKDSTPLDVLAFDEVRLMDPADIDQVQERFAHSPLKHQVYMSTAGFPDTDIHARFLRGTQMIWHTKCGCPDGVVLPDVFPDCVVEHKGETYYRCPKCKYRINDVQNGCYIPHNPTANYNSYSVSQLNSPHIDPADLFDFFKTTTNIKEFWNGKIGRPYVDETNRPITDDVFAQCVDATLKWQCNLPSKRVRGGCAMGVDQHSGNCYVVISKRGKDGKKQLVHLEVIESKNPIYWEYDEKSGCDAPVTPFKRVHQLMDEYGVGMCVIDLMPNANEAHELVRAFPGKVFTAIYRETGQDMVSWGDRPVHKEGVRKGSKEIKNKHQVTLNRYISLDYALKQWTNGIMEVPPIGQLTPVVRSERKRADGRTDGRFVAEPLALRLRDHLKRLVRQETIIDKDTGRSKMEWLYIGGDPHFAHAFSYCNIAMERLRRTAMFVM